MLRTILRWIGSRRRGATTIVSAVAAVALAAAMVGRGCSVRGSGPDGVVRELINAQRTGDAELLYSLLGPNTIAALQTEARRATDLVGGWQRFVPADLVSIGQATPGGGTFEYSVRRIAEDKAQVDIASSTGQKSVLMLVRIDKDWRIEVPEFIAASK